MSNEFARTGMFLLAAIVAVGAAFYVEPESAKSEIFSDTGETFFPSFRDVTAVKAIEVVDYDEADAVARPRPAAKGGIQEGPLGVEFA